MLAALEQPLGPGLLHRRTEQTQAVTNEQDTGLGATIRRSAKTSP